MADRASLVGEPARLTARRAIRSGTGWGSVFGLYVLASATGYRAAYPTLAARQKFAAALTGNRGMASLLGIPHHIETVAGYTAWRCGGVVAVAGSIWALLLATRLTRGEEDAGRWELLLSGPTTRADAAAQAAGGLGAGLLTAAVVTWSWSVLAAGNPNIHVGVAAWAYLALVLVQPAAVFAAVGFLCSELLPSRRSANLVGAALLGGAYLVRMVADTAGGLGWLRGLTPLGWAESARPLEGSRWPALVPAAAFIVLAVGVAVAIAGRRDAGTGLIALKDRAAPRRWGLASPEGLALRLGRGVLIGWILGTAIFGFVLGLVARSAADAIAGSTALQQSLAKLGGRRAGAASYLGVAFLTAAALLAVAAANHVAAIRRDETDGVLDQLMVRAVSRSRWLASRAGLGAVLVVACSLAAGVAAWAGAASQHGGLAAGSLIAAGVNVAAPALLVLGLGTLAFGVRPRLAGPVAFGVVAWSFLAEFAAAAVKNNRWLLDSSVFSHVTPAPAANPNWGAWLAVAALGVVCAGVGVGAFRRRDLAGA